MTNKELPKLENSHLLMAVGVNKFNKKYLDALLRKIFLKKKNIIQN